MTELAFHPDTHAPIKKNPHTPPPIPKTTEPHVTNVTVEAINNCFDIIFDENDVRDTVSRLGILEIVKYNMLTQ